MSPPSQNDGTKSDREIHRLFDGDLSPAEVEALGAEAARDPRTLSATRRKLEALGDLRALVRAAAIDEGEPIDAEATWAQIAARIEGSETETEAKAGAAKRPALRVIEGGLSDRGREVAQAPREDDARPTERAESAPPGLLQRVDRAAAERTEETQRREQQVQQRRTVIMVVTGFAAAAAAAIALLGPSQPGDGDPLVATTTQPPTTTSSPVVAPELDEQLHQTEVLAVDFGSNVGTIFSVEGSEGARYAVVWLTDEADKGADPGADDSRAPEGTTGSENL